MGEIRYQLERRACLGEFREDGQRLGQTNAGEQHHTKDGNKISHIKAIVLPNKVTSEEKGDGACTPNRPLDESDRDT